MARSIQRQLFEAHQRSGLTFGELKRLAGIDCTDESMSRKLRGGQVLFTREAEAIAKALRCEVRYSGRSSAKAA